MIFESNFSYKKACILISAIFLVGLTLQNAAAKRPCSPYGAAIPSVGDIEENFLHSRYSRRNVNERPPETVIDPTLKYGLNLVLPQAIRRNLTFDAGYDRWAGLPTVKAEYFVPVKAWTDKSFYLCPEISLTGTKESFSLGGGFRHLLTSETMIGFHAFHDWVRTRRGDEGFLKQVGVGAELSALLGAFSDVTLSVNAYLPTNEKHTIDRGSRFVREAFTTGGDARLGLLLPPIVDALDIRLDARINAFKGEQTDLKGYSTEITVSSRDGLFRGSLEQTRDSVLGENYTLSGNISLTFDWVALVKGEMPLSAPYQMSTTRFNRKIRDSLYERVSRKHDLPTEKIEKRLALATRVSDEAVLFSGGFPDLPNARLSVQVSQSPWRDCVDVVTDAQGFYSGRLPLEPGTYRFRLLHKVSGKISAEKTIVIPAAFAKD
jgi:hypothetical protein